MRTVLLTVLCAMAIALPVTSAESVFAGYRGLTLGDSVEAAAGHLQAALTEVKVVHARPTLVQQLTWRPHQFVSGVSVEPDPLAEISLIFHLGRLARIAVIYDRSRTEGLTNADLHEALSGTYGTSLLLSAPMRTAVELPIDGVTIGQWGDNETLVRLWRETYPSRVRLTITALAADRAMQDAIADGMRLDATEAPGLDLARRTAEAAALRTRDENIRRDNKATFKP
jgi:hypothetical protein